MNAEILFQNARKAGHSYDVWCVLISDPVEMVREEAAPVRKEYEGYITTLEENCEEILNILPINPLWKAVSYTATSSMLTVSFHHTLTQRVQSFQIWLSSLESVEKGFQKMLQELK